MEALKTIEVRAAPGGNAPGGVANAETPAVMLDGVTKRFGSFTAVDNLTFSVPRGSIFGFLGPNGSGKTTTLGLLLGLVPKDGGNAQILGYDTDNALAQGLARTG